MVALALLRSGERSQEGLGLGFKSDMEKMRSLKRERVREREMFVSGGAEGWRQYPRFSSSVSCGFYLQMSNIASKHWCKMDADERLS